MTRPCASRNPTVQIREVPSAFLVRDDTAPVSSTFREVIGDPDCTKVPAYAPLGPLASRRLSNQLGRRPGLPGNGATGDKAGLGSQMRSGLRPVLLNAGETPAVPGGRCSALVPELGQLFCDDPKALRGPVRRRASEAQKSRGEGSAPLALPGFHGTSVVKEPSPHSPLAGGAAGRARSGPGAGGTVCPPAYPLQHPKTQAAGKLLDGFLPGSQIR